MRKRLRLWTEFQDRSQAGRLAALGDVVAVATAIQGYFPSLIFLFLLCSLWGFGFQRVSGLPIALLTL